MPSLSTQAKIWLHSSICASLTAILLCTNAAKSNSEIGSESALGYFSEAKALAKADDGKLWGRPLYGPIMFVDPMTRSIMANQADLQGLLQPAPGVITGVTGGVSSGVFVGILPDKENIANTAVEWSGVRWTQMVWPLPIDVGPRDILMIHELFHGMQNRLALPRLASGDNRHLDTRAGRYYLQLEWRALARALQATSDQTKKLAVADALLFRWRRYQLFPDACSQEQSLELDEGLAEYTGIKIACTSTTAKTSAAIHDLEVHKGDPSFIRSFAYATGPAYGLLLDHYAPNWKKKLDKNTTFASLLMDALKMAPPNDVEANAKTRALAYEGVLLWQEESDRDASQKAFIEKCRAQFVDGPVLVLPTNHIAFQFDPRNLRPMEGCGIIYPNLRATDDWGILEVTKGALVKPDRSAIVIEAPSDIAGKNLTGNGWTLKLSYNWSILPGARKGDYILMAH